MCMKEAPIMKVEFELDPSCAEPRAVIHAARMTEEVAALIRRLTETPPAFLMGFRDEQAVPLDPAQIIRIYAQAGKVLADTARAAMFSAPGSATWRPGWTARSLSASATARSSISATAGALI